MAWTYRTCKLKVNQRCNLVKFYYFREKKKREGEGGRGRKWRGWRGGKERERRRRESRGGREAQRKKSSDLAQSREQIAIPTGELRVVPWLPIHALFTAKQKTTVAKILPSKLMSHSLFIRWVTLSPFLNLSLSPWLHLQNGSTIVPSS